MIELCVYQAVCLFLLPPADAIDNNSQLAFYQLIETHNREEQL